MPLWEEGECQAPGTWVTFDGSEDGIATAFKLFSNGLIIMETDVPYFALNDDGSISPWPPR